MQRTIGRGRVYRGDLIRAPLRLSTNALRTHHRLTRGAKTHIVPTSEQSLHILSDGFYGISSLIPAPINSVVRTPTKSVDRNTNRLMKTSFYAIVISGIDTQYSKGASGNPGNGRVFDQTTLSVSKSSSRIKLLRPGLHLARGLSPLDMTTALLYILHWDVQAVFLLYVALLDRFIVQFAAFAFLGIPET